MDEDILYGLAAVIAVLFTGLVVLIPIVALTVRLTLKPMLETWMRVKQGVGGEEAALQERRIALLETELQGVQGALRTVLEGEEFRRQLQEGQSHGKPAPPPADAPAER